MLPPKDSLLFYLAFINKGHDAPTLHMPYMLIVSALQLLADFTFVILDPTSLHGMLLFQILSQITKGHSMFLV
jgi:hypothetical protein